MSLGHLYVLKCVALFYAVVAVPCAVRGGFLWLTDPSFRPGVGLPLCIAAAVSALLVFLRPWAGLVGLAVLSLIGLSMAAGHGDGPAVMYHLLVLAVLLGPLSWRQNGGVKPA